MARQKSSLFGHAVEDALVVFEQVRRGIELNDSACVQHHDLWAVHDGVDPVSDGENGAIGKFFPDGGLFNGIREKYILVCKWEQIQITYIFFEMLL